MSAVIELLEQNGLVREEDSLLVAGFAKRKLALLHRQLYDAVSNEQQEALEKFGDGVHIDPFSFVAGRSIRADAGCGELFCRLQKIDFLGRYAALYANRLILPLPLQHPSKIDGNNESARQLINTSLALLRLRPLVDAGIVLPVTMRSFHRCEHEHAWAGRLIEAMHHIAIEAARDSRRDFRIRFQVPEKSPTGLPSAYIEGPEDFLEHGRLVVVFDEGKGWRQRGWRYNRNGMVELHGDRKLVFLYDIFSGIADDTTFYLTYGRDVNSRYLSSQRGETCLLDLATNKDDELAASSRAMQAYMSHTLPLLGDLPLGALLRIRKQERDSFGRYREAVGKILQDVASRKKRIGKKEIQEAFRSQVEPQLAVLKAEMTAERSRQIRRLIGAAGSFAVSVALGAIGHVLPSLAAGGVGTTLLNEAAKSKCNHQATLKEKTISISYCAWRKKQRRANGNQNVLFTPLGQASN